MEGEREGERDTYIFASVLDKCIPAGLAFEEPGLVEEKIELGNFAKL